MLVVPAEGRGLLLDHLVREVQQQLLRRLCGPVPFKTARIIVEMSVLRRFLGRWRAGALRFRLGATSSDSAIACWEVSSTSLNVLGESDRFGITYTSYSLLQRVSLM